MMNDQEKTHLRKLEKNQKKASTELDDLKKENVELLEERDKVYKTVQCMTISYNKTLTAKNRMVEINAKVKSNETKIANRVKKWEEIESDIERVKR